MINSNACFAYFNKIRGIPSTMMTIWRVESAAIIGVVIRTVMFAIKHRGLWHLDLNPGG
jgi:hypothetical protein